MTSSFVIYQTSTSLNERPPISYKIREYYEKFIIENVLIKKNIITNGKWNIVLNIGFMRKGPKVLFNGIVLGKGTRTISTENIRLYEVLILIEPIQTSSNPLLKTIELMYEAIKLFFISTYRKATPEFMDELWKQVDLNYLLSLPYPAPFEEQKYLNDEQLYKVEFDGSVRKTTLLEQADRVGYKGVLK